MEEKIITDLLAMSHHLGNPNNDFVILGEGNVSANLDSNTFLVKASGAYLKDLDREDLVKVSFEKILSSLQKNEASRDKVQACLQNAAIHPNPGRLPSSETFFHAILLKVKGVNFIGHTHPTAVNAILCSQNASEIFSKPIFPYQEEICGPTPMFVPYSEPGFPLALAILEKLQVYLEQWGTASKVILLQSHGMIALGNTGQEVLNITTVFNKAARIMAGTTSFGGPRYLT